MQPRLRHRRVLLAGRGRVPRGRHDDGRGRRRAVAGGRGHRLRLGAGAAVRPYRRRGGRGRPVGPAALPGRGPAGRPGRAAAPDRGRDRLPLIAYQRGQVAFTAEGVRQIADIPTVIGLKDGHSDLDRLQRLTLAAPEDFLFFNGASTAEIQARAYATVGVPAYSSAVHAFAPEIANAFFDALTDGDDAGVTTFLREFYVPLVELRDRVPGYAVSLLKAAARLRGLPVGPVRAPLTDPGPADLADLADLAKILDHGLGLVGAVRRPA